MSGIRSLLRRRGSRRDPAADAGVSPEALDRVRRLELRTRGAVESLFSGENASIFHGRGLEFDHVRLYAAGDDVRAIDWKVTARRGEAYVRRFVEERDQLILLVVDVSGSGRLGPGDRSASEAAEQIAAALTFAAVRNHDRVALLLVSDRVERVVPAGSGRRHGLRLLSALVSHRPARRQTDLTPALEWIVRHVTGRATVFLLSDFIQDHRQPRYREALGRVALTHDLVTVRLASRATSELPDVGWLEVTDPESGRRVILDTGSAAVRDRYRRGIRRTGVDLTNVLVRAGAELVEVDTEMDVLLPIVEFHRRRRRPAR